MSISNNKKFYGVMVISFLIMLLFGNLQPFGAMTEYGMKFLGIFLGCIFGWLFNIIVPVSLMGIIMSGFLISGQTVDKMMISLQGANMVLMVFWAFFFVYALKQCGLLNFLSKKIMSLSFCSKSPWHLAVALWICTMVCAGLTGQPFASAFLMFGMYYSVAEKVGAQKRSSYTNFVLVVIAAIADISTCMVPYSGNILMALSIMSAAVPGIEYNIPLICLVNIAVTVFSITIISILFKLLLYLGTIKPEFNMNNHETLFEDDAVFDTKIKWGFFYIVLLVSIMMLPSFLPADNVFKTFLAHMGTTGMFVVVALLMCVTNVNGEPLLDIETAIKDGAVNWQVYFMMGTAIVISGQLVSAEAGLSITIQGLLDGFAANMSIYILCLLIMLFGLILTNCITNAVAMQLIIPILAICMAAKGVNPAIMVGLAGKVLNHGLILPSGSPLGAFIHGNSEWIEPKSCYINSTLTSTCLAIAIAIIGIPMALFWG